ncbi:MAG: ChbG/HpnK family deacetylase [Reichenbachiella sp.]|uniref:ChbG/HpnK family deacetylase n=1 Tax=Reichenbachiella sp. TaxID=2184521 RepID=UPI0032633B6E
MSNAPFKGVISKLENIRKGRPSIHAEQIGYKNIGEEIQILHSVTGEVYNGNDKWYVLTDGTFMWSGVIYTPVEVTHIEKKILVTADDIGILDIIDQGAISALENGWINSIAVLVNHPGDDPDDPSSYYLNGLVDKLSAKRRKSVNGTESKQNLLDSTHIGLHFTMNSGGPVNYKFGKPYAKDGYKHITKGRFFKSAFLMSEDRLADPKVKEAIYYELDEQYNKFKNVFGREPDHLTSHFDVLTFTQELFEYALDWTNKKGIPMRTHRFLPRIKRVLYDIPFTIDLPSIKRLDKWEHALGRREGIKDPQNTMVDHYGPDIPFIAANYPNQIIKKQNKLKEWMENFLVSDDNYRELVIHLLKEKPRKQRWFKKKYKKMLKTDYPGINVSHFDGRLAEYLSLQECSPWNTEKHPEIRFMEP